MHKKSDKYASSVQLFFFYFYNYLTVLQDNRLNSLQLKTQTPQAIKMQFIQNYHNEKKISPPKK